MKIVNIFFHKLYKFYNYILGYEFFTIKKNLKTTLYVRIALVIRRAC